MKTIKTKSIQSPASPRDGLRVCIMRRVKPEFEFDIWLPHLAPSTELLRMYQEDNLPWEQFQEAFRKEMKHKKKYLKLLKHLNTVTSMTLLCWEEKADFCHRSIILELVTA